MICLPKINTWLWWTLIILAVLSVDFTAAIILWLYDKVAEAN